MKLEPLSTISSDISYTKIIIPNVCQYHKVLEHFQGYYAYCKENLFDGVTITFMTSEPHITYPEEKWTPH